MYLEHNIRQMRQSRGWAQDQLSQPTGIKIGHLSKLEQDEGGPKAWSLCKLIQVFGCTSTGLMANWDPRREGTEADALWSMIWKRFDNLPNKAKMSLVGVLDRFCIGWEMGLVVTQFGQGRVAAPCSPSFATTRWSSIQSALPSSERV